jgi:alpha-1,2-mannosyltransferase
MPVPVVPTAADGALPKSFLSLYQLPAYAVVAAVCLVIAVLSVLSLVPPERRLVAVTWYRLPPVMAVAALLGVTATVVWAVHSGRVSPRGFVDLSVYRLGVAAWWHDANLYGVLPLTAVGMALPFTYPPFAVLVLSPLAVPPWQVSIACVTALSLVSLTVVVYVTTRAAWPHGGRRGALVATAAVVPLSLLLEPVADTIWFGQVNLMLMALVVYDCVVPAKHRPRGLLIGIAAAIKLTPAVFLLFFLLRKDYRAAVTMTISALVATGIGFVVDWSGSLTFWFSGSGGAHSVGDPSALVNQSLVGGLARFGLSGAAQAVAMLVLLPVVSALVVAGIRRALRSGSLPTAVVVTALLGLLVSPISWGHHWVYVVPAVIVLVAHGIQQRRRVWLFAAGLVVTVFHAAAFLGVGIDRGWAPLRLLETNSFALTALTLLAAYAGPDVLRGCRPVAATLIRRARGLPAMPTLPTLPAMSTLPAAPTLPTAPTLPAAPTLPVVSSLPSVAGDELTQRRQPAR